MLTTLKQTVPNIEEFNILYNKIVDEGHYLTFTDLGRVFGESFWELLVSALSGNRQTVIIEKQNVE